MISVTICGPILCTINLMPPLPLNNFMLLFWINFIFPYNQFSAIMVVNSSTMTFMLFSPIMASPIASLVPTHPPEMGKPSEPFEPQMISCALSFCKHTCRHNTRSALHTSTYLLNRRPCKPINLKTPYEVLFHRQPDYSHLRIFGCLCYPNLFTSTPHKLAPHSCRCVFLGYSPEHKDYRCMHLDSRKLIISRHVILDETCFPFQHQQPHTGSATTNPPASTLDGYPAHLLQPRPLRAWRIHSGPVLRRHTPPGPAVSIHSDPRASASQPTAAICCAISPCSPPSAPTVPLILPRYMNPMECTRHHMQTRPRLAFLFPSAISTSPLLPLFIHSHTPTVKLSRILIGTTLCLINMMLW